MRLAQSRYREGIFLLPAILTKNVSETIEKIDMYISTEKVGDYVLLRIDSAD